MVTLGAALGTFVSAPVAAGAQSQASTGVIRGSVLDPAGTAVAGAVVRMTHRETGLVTTVLTTRTGTFVRPLLPLGGYDVVAQADDQLGSASAPGLILRVGEELNLALRFSAVELEGITVEGNREHIVYAEDVTSSTRLSEEVVDGLPNNGRNYLDFALLTPGVAISQGPDGDELNISGQRGIFNNFIVDGADFNNPFFGEQRGGQRPAFTFSQDAIEEVVVVNQGASAEFGRSAGGFVNVITKSGTNELSGSAHYFGQWDGVSAAYPVAAQAGEPDFLRNQFGFTLGGPIARDRAFFFVAYDQQEAAETKQMHRVVENPANLAKLQDFLTSQWPGLFESEFGPISRTDDARALLAKADFHLDGRNQVSFKYNYNWSEQLNGTFDVDSWGLSANGIEMDEAHAFNASWRSLLSSTLSHELRVQWAREDRVRWYDGPLMPGATPPATPQFVSLGGRPFPDIGMDFADGFRIGLPFFLPIDPAYDTRLQVVDNWSWLRDRHLFKAGIEYNRTAVSQQFIGFANGRYVFDSVDGFINFVTHGSRYVTCSDGSDSATGSCPEGAAITGPVLLYLQSGTVPGVAPERLGRGDFGVSELAFYLQDTWKPNDRVTLNLGVRWEGTWHPQVAVAAERDLLCTVSGRPPLPFGRHDPRRSRQLPAAPRPRLGRVRGREHGGPAQRRCIPRAHPHIGVRAERDHQRRLPADLLPQQLRTSGAGAARGRRAHRRKRHGAVPPRHSCDGEGPGTAPHLVVRGRGRAAAGRRGGLSAFRTSTPGATISSASSTATMRRSDRPSAWAPIRAAAASARSPWPRARRSRATTR